MNTTTVLTTCLFCFDRYFYTHVRINKLMFHAAVFSTLETVDLIVFLRSGVVFDRGPCALLLDQELAKLHADVTHLAPVFTPGVSDNPVAALCVVMAPASDRNHVIDSLAPVGGDTGGVVEDRSGVNSASNRTAFQDFILHVFRARDHAVLSDRGVGVGRDGSAFTTWREGGTRARNIFWCATPVSMRANAFARLRTARKIGVGSLVRNSGSSCFRDFVDPLVRADDRSSVA